MRGLLLLALLGLLSACYPVKETPTPPAKPVPVTAVYRAGSYAELPGWPGQYLQNGWTAWLASCKRLAARTGWQAACTDAQAVSPTDTGAQQRYFETHFTPYQVTTNTGSDSGLITGYYEAQLNGGHEQKPGRVPIYGVPDDLLTIDLGSLYPELKGQRVRGRLDGRTVKPYWTRADIDNGKDDLSSKVLAWADDPIDAFFLEVQGSGRIQLDDGTTLRVGYADQNGQPYKSIGKWLVDQGQMTIDQVSMQGIRAWAQAHPERLKELLEVNPSLVFFRALPDDGSGAPGAFNVPLTAQASIAVDPKFIPLGSPIYLSTTMPHDSAPLQRLVQAQDTGGAIRGPVRADFFWGFGPSAADEAGKMKQQGQLWLLWPNGLALPAGQ